MLSTSRIANTTENLMKRIIVTFIFLAFFTQVTHAASKHVFRNLSIEPIFVIMDTCREIHRIPAESEKVFVEANPFDQPTFRVVLDEVKECNRTARARSVFSKKVDIQCAISANCFLEWTGKEIK